MSIAAWPVPLEPPACTSRRSPFLRDPRRRGCPGVCWRRRGRPRRPRRASPGLGGRARPPPRELRVGARERAAEHALAGVLPGRCACQPGSKGRRRSSWLRAPRVRSEVRSPAASSRTRAPFPRSAAVGSGTSSYFRTSGPPPSWMTIACIAPVTQDSSIVATLKRFAPDPDKSRMARQTGSRRCSTSPTSSLQP